MGEEREDRHILGKTQSRRNGIAKSARIYCLSLSSFFHAGLYQKVLSETCEITIALAVEKISNTGD